MYQSVKAAENGDTGNIVDDEFNPPQEANGDDVPPDAETSSQTHYTKLYRRRWLMLAVFVSYSTTNAYQWIHLNIISNRVMTFWNVSIPGDDAQKQLAIDWLSMIYMLAYIPLILPATWFLDHKGLRICGIAATILNMTGAWLKCGSLSVEGDRFYLLMMGQTFCALAQVFILGIPAHLAALWFGPDEVSTATALGVFGNQVGVAIGFAFPPMIVPDPATNSPEIVMRGFQYMFYTGAVISTLLVILVLCVFKCKPPLPPSLGQLALVASGKGTYTQSLTKLICNRSFLLLAISYGINTGSYYAIGTLLNPLLLPYFPEDDELLGWAGFTMVIAGVAGSIVAGIWLDKTKTFKATTLGIYIMTLVCMGVFAGTIHFRLIWIVFVVMFLLGFFMTGYLPVGFEFAAEITYPENEGTSSGILNALAQTFGIILTTSCSMINTKFSTLAANLTIIVFLVVGTILTGLIKSDLRRQKAHAEGQKAMEIFIEDNNE